MIDFRCIIRKQPYNIGASKHGNRKYQHRCRRNKPHTDRENLFLLNLIPVSIVKSDDRCYSHRVADIQRVQQELRVNNNRDCRNAILSQQVHHSAVEQKCCDGCCQLAYHFGGAVKTAFSDDCQFQFWPCERQRSFVPSKICQPSDCGNQITKACPQSCALDTQTTGDNEDIIQNYICHARQDRQPKTKARFSSRHKQV